MVGENWSGGLCKNDDRDRGILFTKLQMVLVQEVDLIVKNQFVKLE
jgi:hypothetical protein